MSKGSDFVKNWRKRTKQRMIDSMGGKCVICGYNKCQEALDLHHIDPSKKEMSFGHIRANIKSWEKIANELKKCVLLCANCHREIHNGFVDLPNSYPTFDDNFSDYKKDIIYKKDLYDSCPVCGEQKPISNKTCSLKCMGKKNGKVDWDNIDLQKLIDEYKYNTEIGAILGVSECAIRKRRKKLGI